MWYKHHLQKWCLFSTTLRFKPKWKSQIPLCFMFYLEFFSFWPNYEPFTNKLLPCVFLGNIKRNVLFVTVNITHLGLIFYLHSFQKKKKGGGGAVRETKMETRVKKGNDGNVCTNVLSVTCIHKKTRSLEMNTELERKTSWLLQGSRLEIICGRSVSGHFRDKVKLYLCLLSADHASSTTDRSSVNHVGLSTCIFSHSRDYTSLVYILFFYG